MLSILLIPAALTYTFGKMVGSTRQGWAILAAMLLLLWVPLGLAYASEQSGNPALTSLGVDQTASATNPGGNMEGKEVRFGIANSALWAATTTAASNGSVNSMHDSYTPLGGSGPPMDDDAGRGFLRRGRLRLVRNAGLRHRGCLCSRADGGTHSRVPGQEDRIL